MKRRVVTAVGALWLLACILSIAAWVRSYWFEDSWLRQRADGRDLLWSSRGAVVFTRMTYERVRWPQEPSLTDSRHPVVSTPSSTAPTTRAKTGIPSPAAVRDWTFLGFKWEVRPGGTVTSGSRSVGFSPMWRVGLPFWFITLVFAVLPIAWMTRLLARRVRHPGVCPTCGYDLRATPQRCPECGTVSAEVTT